MAAGMLARLSIMMLLVGACAGDDEPDVFDLEGFPYLVDFRVWHYATGQAEISACAYRYSLCEDAGTVEVEQGGQSVTLGHDRESSGEWFVAFLETTSADAPYRFTWSGAGDQSSVTGEVWLADGFSFSAPSSGSTVSATSPLTLEWTGGSSEGVMAWGYRASCPDSTTINDFRHIVPDTGHIEVATDRLSFFDGCFAELWLERLERGTTSSPLANIMSSESRYVEVTVGP